MATLKLILVQVVALMIFFNVEARHLFPAIFTFGDSTVDVGTNNYLKYESIYTLNFLPYGKDFMPKSGRASDGKLVIDYISDFSRLPYAPPFLKPHASFKYGANFGSVGAGVLSSTHCLNDTICISLPTQIAQFATIQPSFSQAVLSESLFVISAGANDYLTYLGTPSLQKALNLTSYVTLVLSTLQGITQSLYALGARKFIVVNVAAVGCVPASLAAFNVPKTKPQCLLVPNEIVAGHNAGLLELITEVAATVPDIHIILGDAYGYSLAVSTNARQFGFREGHTACCGGGPFNGYIQCGTTGATVCNRATNYVYWDLFHGTQYTNRQLAYKLFLGNNPYVYPISVKELGLL